MEVTAPEGAASTASWYATARSSGSAISRDARATSARLSVRLR
jgi:hypothetical protein